MNAFAKNGMKLHHPRIPNESMFNSIILGSETLKVCNRASRKVPSEVAEWTQFMKRKTGAVFFILGSYTNANGQLVTSREVHMSSPDKHQ